MEEKGAAFRGESTTGRPNTSIFAKINLQSCTTA
jgi:hypothetical protein